MIGIYKIVSPTGKIYIGQSSDVNKRKKDYEKTIHCKGQIRLYNSLLKHGFNNHEFIVVEECEIDDLNKRERYWQDYHDVIGQNGLNCKLTSCQGKRMVLSEEARKKISNSVKLNQPMRRPELRALFSEKFSGEKNPMFNMKGNLNKASKKIIDTSTGKIFACIREASDFYGIKYSTLKSMINGTNKNKTNLIYYQKETMKDLQLNTPLPIEEIDFRVQSINNGGYATMLAYKSARIDMTRLDDVVGTMNWQRKHEFINGKLFCHVGIYNPSINEWVWKSDVGTESMTEASKGESSDSFKRACFNWGIGRELYDYPVISVKLNDNEWTKDGGRPKQTYNLHIRDWKWYSEFTDGKLTFIAAKDENGKVRFKWGVMKPKQVEPEYKAAAAPEVAPEATVEAPAEIVPTLVVEEGNVQGMLKKEAEVHDYQREQAIAMYEEAFGKKPHHKMSTLRIIEEYQREAEKEEVVTTEEPTVVEPTIADAEIVENDASILDYLDMVDEFKDPAEFVKWAKEIVSLFVNVDSESTIQGFRQVCNEHYSKLVKR